MTDKDMLVKLIARRPELTEALNVSSFRLNRFVDYLIENGVMMANPNAGLTPVDLKGKCGSCVYAKPIDYGSSAVHVECTNIAHIKKYCGRHYNARVRPRTARGCKNYVKVTTDSEMIVDDIVEKLNGDNNLFAAEQYARERFMAGYAHGAKSFAEKLRQRVGNPDAPWEDHPFCESDIDEVLKEMEGQ